MEVLRPTRAVSGVHVTMETEFGVDVVTWRQTEWRVDDRDSTAFHQDVLGIRDSTLSMALYVGDLCINHRDRVESGIPGKLVAIYSNSWYVCGWLCGALEEQIMIALHFTAYIVWASKLEF